MTSFTSCAVTGAVCSVFITKKKKYFFEGFWVCKFGSQQMETFAESRGESTSGSSLSHQIVFWFFFSLWIIAKKFKQSICANRTLTVWV